MMLWTSALFAASTALPSYAGAAADPAGLEFFESKVRPIFVDHCYSCHSVEAGKNKGGLHLDTRDAVLKGGDSGPALIAGEPDKSLLIKAVRYTDENLQMPPKGKKLSAEQIAALEQWVKIGAPDPRTGTTNAPDKATAAKSHWAFQPVKNPAVPNVKNAQWAKTPIDHFILAKLEEKNLSPAARADKRTLIRRATMDLTGVPPTYEEVVAFEKDRSPDAFAKVVDRLLASPRYGERWGRHWLDVARYADTKGYLAGNEERRFPYSYTYRDWVIRALNEDLPYDQFLVQQIAADQLDLGENKQALAAMGFLTLGRRFLNNRHDIIDDRIDVVTRGTLALTVGCARCHDHKYDPIPTKDYYSLYGVFDSSHEPEDKPLLGIAAPEKLHGEYLAEKKRREQAVVDYRDKKIAEAFSSVRTRVGDYLLAAYDTEHLTDKTKTESLARGRNLNEWVVQRWITSISTWSKETNAVFGPWAKFAAIPESEFAAKAKDTSAAIASDKSVHPMVAKLFEGEAPKSLKEVSERYGKLFSDIEKAWRDALGQSRKDNVHTAVPKTLADADQEKLRQYLYADGMPAAFSEGEAERLFDVPTIERIRELNRQVAELDAVHPGAPPRGMTLADNSTPSNPYVFVRGNAGNRGPEVPRQFLEVLSGPDRKPFQRGSGRLELAQAIANKTNPLTARVMVNRVWLHHFGKGLVSTPSDFGVRSDPPSHPELLDWLAYNFTENGWSLKKLHRQIMLSAVYQQSSTPTSSPANATAERTFVPTNIGSKATPVSAAQVDPENKLLWRMNRQRLEFEAMRDSLLAVSGKLEATKGGQPIDITTEPFSGRRSIYGFIDRQNLPGLFRTFDFANPDATSPQRFFTTVPQQALFLLNSPFVVEQARILVTNKTFRDIPTDRQKVAFLHKRIFQREPDKDETLLGQKFIKQQIQITPMPVNTSPWKYGYGRFDEKTQRVTEFTAFPHFTGQQYQQSAEFPDPRLSYTMLNREGGHPGGRAQQSAIRRWIAPFDGWISIEGELFHFMDKGDGILGRVVSSRIGQVNSWVSFNQKTPTTINRCEVRHGDTIDFVVEPRTSPAHDTFKWAPVIKVVEVKYGTPPPLKMDWNSTRDFDGPPIDRRPLTAWEKYAQALMISNEFIFVD